MVIPFLPGLAVLGDGVNDAMPGLVQSIKLLHVLPSILGEPNEGLLGLNCLQRSVTFQEEVHFDLVELFVSVHDHGNHLEAVHEFVLFEDAHADELVHQLSELLFDVPQSVVKDVVLT